MNGGKHRRPCIVVDTNVFVGNFVARRTGSPNRWVIRTWLVERKLRLAVSSEVTAEYLRVFEEVLGFGREQLSEWRRRFADGRLVRRVRLGPRPRKCHDPADDVFVATAVAGRAQFLVTSDEDLLCVSADVSSRPGVKIVRPGAFRRWWECER